MTKRNLRSKKSSVGNDSEQHYEKKIRDLESVNESLKCDVEELRSKLADVSISSSAGTLQSSREFSHKSIATNEQGGMSSRSKSNLHSMCSTKKYKTESSVKQVDGEVRKLKAQKVKLQCKIKLDSMHFRLLKASLEKEVLQLKKELRKSEFEKHVLSALNSRQKLILQLKNTQALTALKRLKLLLQSKKTSSTKNNGPPKGTSSRIQESNDESRLLMKLNKIHSDYERQMKEIAEEVKKFSLEADDLKAEFEGEQNSFSASSDNRINHTPMDSELKELKEELNKLSTLVSQMEMTKSQLSETDKIQQEELAKHSVSSNITNDEAVVEPSQLKISEETLCNTNDQSNLEPSEPKTSEETLCKPAESSVSSKNTNDQSSMESSELKTSEEPVCKKEQSKAEVCCSCTKKSSCKTKNCKCRANGSGCGDSCGCVAAKCSNREEIIRPDKSMEPAAGITHDDLDAKKQPLRDIGNIREAEKAGKVKKVLKPVVKKTK